MLLKIIAEIIIGHNRVINNSYLPGHLPPEKGFKSDQATQRAIHTTAAAILSLLLTFIRLFLIALLSTTARMFPAPLMRDSCGRPLCTTGRQRHRLRKQGQDRNQQYEGVQMAHYIANIAKTRTVSQYLLQNPYTN